MTICGPNNKMVYKWAKENLDDYIKDDFPSFWQDSLTQILDGIPLKISVVDNTSEIWKKVAD
jgi:hypothetical protein